MPKNKSYEVKEYADRPYEKFARNDLYEDRPGAILPLTCNDAIARGAIEAGVKVAACYPGAPVTYVLEALAHAARIYPEMHVEWSANEKCAYEVALGAVMSGARAMCIMKNVGMSWIADPLVSSSMLGVTGLVVVVADDPAAETSQVEEDSRWLARFAEVPVLEPSSVQETKELVKYAFDLSEEIAMPVVLRITVRLGYARAPVALGEIAHAVRRRRLHFDKTGGWKGGANLNLTWPDAGPTVLHKRFHGEVDRAVLGRMSSRPTQAAVQAAVEACAYHQVSDADGEICIVTAGLSHEEVRETLALVDAQRVAVAKLAITYPVPETLLRRVLGRYRTVVVVEEGEPIMEDQVRVLATMTERPARIIGKRTGHIPYAGEITSEVLATRLSRLFGWSNPLQSQLEAVEASLEFLRDRVPFRIGGQFCAGCPETAPTLILRKVLDSIADETVVCGDSGCGTIAAIPPIELVNSFICMGAGLGVAQGIYHSGIDAKAIAVMGDSTFFHSGIVELINAVYNRANVLLMILDNKATAETGQQPHPGAFGITASKQPTKELALEDLVRACQVDFVKVVDAYDVRELEDAYREALRIPGVSVVIARGTCALIVDRQRKESKIKGGQSS